MVKSVKAIVIPPAADAYAVDWPGTTTARLDLLYREIGCDAVDAVRTDSATVWVDDEGMLIDEPVPNVRAAIFARRPLYGTAVVTARPDGPDSPGLDDEHAEKLLAALAPPRDVYTRGPRTRWGSS